MDIRVFRNPHQDSQPCPASRNFWKFSCQPWEVARKTGSRPWSRSAMSWRNLSRKGWTSAHRQDTLESVVLGATDAAEGQAANCMTEAVIGACTNPTCPFYLR